MVARWSNGWTMYELELIESDQDLEADLVRLYSLDEALSLRASLLGSAGSSASSFVECGDALRRFGARDEALACYGDGIRQEQGYWPAYLARAEIFFELAVCAEVEEEVVAHGKCAVSDFRMAMLLSRRSSDVVWRLGSAHLVIGESCEARALAERMIGDSGGTDIKDVVDFLYLLGFAKLFTGDREGAFQTFEELTGTVAGYVEGLFGKVVVWLASGELEKAGAGLRGLVESDRELYQAGLLLRETGCGSFLDVARALVGIRMGNGAAGVV